MREYFSLLPFEIVNEIRLIKEPLAEIRIRRGRVLCVTVIDERDGSIGFHNRTLGIKIDRSLMSRTIETLTGNSLYSHENTVKEGYITVQDIFRIGVSGKALSEKGEILQISRIDSLCLRVIRDAIGTAGAVYRFLENGAFRRSLLIFAPPGYGKTTLIRDLSYTLALRLRVALIDSRFEIATKRAEKIPHLDILSGYPKAKGIEIAARVLFPEYLICDEIGQLDELSPLLAVQNVGVPIVMTAHAGSVSELFSKELFVRLHQKHVFDAYALIDRLHSDREADLSFYLWEEISL